MSQFKRNRTQEQEQMTLDLGVGKIIEANFDGGRISTDGGLLLLRKADDMLELTETAALCLTESRREDALRHTNLNMLRQRVNGIAPLYVDCNDAQFLRHDDMQKLAVGRLPSGEPLASQLHCRGLRTALTKYL